MISKDNWQLTQDIFEQALALPALERQSFVEAACDDPSLATKIKRMLSFADTSHDAIHSVIEDAVAILENPEALLGQKIGSYRLVQLLGEGGMGAVYLAERDDWEFQHRVAIKLIKRQLHHPELQSLFQNERQILADMNHPYICRLMDGGRTESGQIYIVMEYVAGLPIDQHCEDRQLSTRARLELFLKVCTTIQALHQKLVIHCDLKPGNILINDSGDPKLLDFGIAQAASRIKSETGGPKTIAGGYTLEYSSPEQILGERADVTSDVYSLGMILFEILSGRSPPVLNRQELTRLRQEGGSQPGDAMSIGIHPQLLGIFRRATQLQSQARYPTVESMIADVRRYLMSFPILGMPAPVSYRMACWLRRHRFLAIASLVFCCLSGIWLYREHSLQARVEKAAQSDREVTEFLANIFRDIDPYSYDGKPLTGIEILDSALVQIGQSLKLGPDTASRLKLRLANSYRALGASDKAEKILLSALEVEQSQPKPSQERIATLLGALAENARQAYQLAQAKVWFEQAETLWSKLDTTSNSMEFQHHYSMFLLHQFDTGKADALNAAVRDFCRQNQQGMQEVCLGAEHERARILSQQSRFQDAVAQFESTLVKQKQHFGERSLHVLHTLSSHIEMLRQHNRFDGLEEKMLDSVKLVKDIHPPGHPYRNKVMNVLANFYHDQAQYPQAIAVYRQMIAETEGTPHQNGFPFAGMINNLALVFSEMERYDEAWSLFQRGLDLQSSSQPTDSPYLSYAYQQMGFVAILRQDLVVAEGFLQKALGIRLKHPDQLSIALTLEQLALVHVRSGKLSLAKDFMQKAWKHSQGQFVENDMREARFFATDAQLMHALGQGQDALHKIDRSLDIVRKARSQQHPIFAKYLVKKAEFLASPKDLKIAIAILERTVDAKAPSLLKARAMLNEKSL